jgi:hypothetical protein
MNWQKKHALDLQHMRKRYYGHTKTTKYHEHQTVQTGKKLALTETVMPAFTNGKVKSITESTVEVDFGRLGTHKVALEAAFETIQPVQTRTPADSMRRSIELERKLSEGLPVGSRVKDESGTHYVVEKTDTFGRAAQVMNHQGDSLILPIADLTRINEEEPFQLQVQQTGSAVPSGKVRVTGINTELNFKKRYPVRNGEMIIGETGIIQFVYRVGDGMDLYRVLLSKGGTYDFAAGEIAPAA